MISTVALQIDLGASSIPHVVFDAIHLVLLLVVGYFGVKAFRSGQTASLFAYGFLLYVIAEISYLGYHFGVTTFLLSHTISEVLVLVAFVLVYLGGRDAGVISG